MKKYFLYAVAMVLIINVLGIVGVLAVFTFNQFENVTYDFEKVDLEVITSGNVDIEDAEATTYTAGVSFRNLSSTPVLIRAIPVEQWTNATGNVIASGNITIGFHTAVFNALNAPVDASSVGRNWFLGSDGYFYYYELVCPMETTTPLMVNYRINSVAGQYTGATLDLSFLAESVQAEGNVWSQIFSASSVPAIIVTNWTAGGVHTTQDLLTLPRAVKTCP